MLYYASRAANSQDLADVRPEPWVLQNRLVTCSLTAATGSCTPYPNKLEPLCRSNMVGKGKISRPSVICFSELSESWAADHLMGSRRRPAIVDVQHCISIASRGIQRRMQHRPVPPLGYAMVSANGGMPDPFSFVIMLACA